MHHAEHNEAFSVKVKAGQRKSYFFDLKPTRSGEDFYLSITESNKLPENEGGGHRKFRIRIYKEDINKFVNGLQEAVDYMKTELLPNYDFAAYSYE